MTRRISLLGIVALLSGCVTTSRIDRTSEPLQKLLAEHRDAMLQCAPVELARAEHALDATRHESYMGRPVSARQFLDEYENQVKAAYLGSRDPWCLPDRDGDGIPDREDECPDKPGPASTRGCPIPDSDGDGIPDEQDKCPSQPGPAVTGGCPVRDMDGDGVPDHQDKCPGVPGPAANNGCPLADSDGDGLPDDQDACPREAGPAENKGCPYQRIRVTDTRIELNERVFFQTGKARILPESFPLLGEVAQALRSHPALKVRVEGHTDSVGNERANKRLSQERAQSVRQYLVGLGIAPDRLVPVGYGDERPIDDNSTAAGRAVNRRVEFHILSK
jgi:outer membrane protein OmpA-like peptidoglycan-associated protein